MFTVSLMQAMLLCGIQDNDDTMYIRMGKQPYGNDHFDVFLTTRRIVMEQLNPNTLRVSKIEPRFPHYSNEYKGMLFEVNGGKELEKASILCQ